MRHNYGMLTDIHRPCLTLFKIMEKGITKIINAEQLIVTQANSLIYARYKITLLEKRLLLLLISIVRKNDKNFGCYRIPVTEILNYLGLENNNDSHRRLKAVTRTLLGRVLEINVGNGSWEQFQWLSSSRLYFPER